MNSTLAAPWTPVNAAKPDDSPPSTAGLDDWPLQVPGVIHSFVSTADHESQRTQRRLAELGFLPGETVRLVARGWLRHSPVAVRVGQSTFALRAHEAAQLRIRPAEAAR